MAAAGLADIMNVRVLYFISALLVLAAGIWVLFLPGLRQDAAQWRRAMGLLRAAPSAPGLGAGRTVTLADFDALVGILPALAALNAKEREDLIGHSQIVEAPSGTAILRYNDQSDAAYFILSGRAMAGFPSQEGGFKRLSEMVQGDFFGEIAALTGARRTADVVAQEDTTLMQVPSTTLRGLMGNPALSQLFLSKMTERLNRTSLSDLPRFAGVDQQDLKDLRAEPIGQPVE
jgi:CRP-like cAMP-binding protein